MKDPRDFGVTIVATVLCGKSIHLQQQSSKPRLRLHQQCTASDGQQAASPHAQQELKQSQFR